MRTKLRGIRNIPSTMKLEQSRHLHAKAGSEYEIFSKLARLEREKGWLSKVRENWQENLKQIDARLLEIEEQRRSLQQQVSIQETVPPAVQDDAKPADANEKHEVIVRY